MNDSNLVSTEALQERLEVSRSTIWRLRQEGMPFRRVGRSVRFIMSEVEDWLKQNGGEQGRASGKLGRRNSGRWPEQPTLPSFKTLNDKPETAPALPPCHWSPEVALDPKHRPQTVDRPSATVRRDWRKYPQEAHLLDTAGHRFRRLTPSEIAALQGFPDDWAEDIGLTHRERIAGLGNAVPPPLGKAVHNALSQVLDSQRLTAVELCAGFGGLALGAHHAGGFEMLAMIEYWEAAVRVLRSAGIWRPERVHHSDVRDFDWDSLKGQVDVLTGGPPCQPWSQGGHSRGATDERDLLGEMPDIVRRASPRAFVFENVPGLVSKTHAPYLESLVADLRNEGYGVAVGMVNAADYGVPQKRRRILIVGLRDMPDGDAHGFFDALSKYRTHADPTKALPRGRRPWNTVGDALPRWSDEGGWRRWVDIPQRFDEMTEPEPDNVPALPAGAAPPGAARQPSIGLVWPGRHHSVRWTDGHWTVAETRDESAGAFRPILQTSAQGRPVLDPWYVQGNHLEALEALRPSLSRQAKLVYFEPPRLDTDLAAFAADDPRERLNTWLTLNQATIRRAASLIRDDGVLVILAGSAEQPYLQVQLDEMFGPDNRVGTIVWQKGYSVQGQNKDKPKKDVYPTHDCLLVYSRRREECLPGAALKGPPKKFSNPDDDPRGPWKAEQKGANYRRDSSDFSVKLPPYRWEVVGGDLPPWFWRISPKSGVIWAPADLIDTPGTWTIRVRVSDSEGNSSEREFEIHVAAEGAPPAPVAPSWLIARDRDGNPVHSDTPPNAPTPGGPVRILTAKLPNGVVGRPFYACIESEGGSPFEGTTRPGKTATGGKGRYWDLSYSRLEQAAAEDAIDFKSRDDSIPAAKVFLDGASFTYLNQISTWTSKPKDPTRPGWGSDAKKELEALHKRGLIDQVVNIGKPSGLVSRLLGMFTEDLDTVVDIGSATAEFASNACQLDRRAVYVEVPGSEEIGLSIRRPRLATAARGDHPIPDGVLFFDSHSELGSDGYYVGQSARSGSPSGDVCVFDVGEPFICINSATTSPIIDYKAYPSDSELFERALASVEGLIWCRDRDEAFATNLDGNLLAFHFDGRTVLDRKKVEDLIEACAPHLQSHSNRIRIYYHRGYPESAPYDRQVELRHLPFGLIVAGGGGM